MCVLETSLFCNNRSVVSSILFRPLIIGRSHCYPFFQKFWKKIIHSQLSLYIDKHNIINPLQFGFRKNHSTYMPIAHMVDQITSSLQEKFITCVLYVDLKKAFDTVSKDILLKKLAFIGVRGKLHEILKSYLTNRKQKTQVNAHLSEETNVEMGVPQGSILGPLLFIIYINDISNISKTSWLLLICRRYGYRC